MNNTEALQNSSIVLNMWTSQATSALADRLYSFEVGHDFLQGWLRKAAHSPQNLKHTNWWKEGKNKLGNVQTE
jgi:hypothetical protein